MIFIKNYNFLILVFYTTLLIISTFNRKKLTYKGLQIVLIFNNLLVFVFFSFSWTVYIVNYQQDFVNIKLNANNWQNINYELDFKISSLSYLFILLVSAIGFSTNIYAFNYFKFEDRGEDFILLINWFIVSMLFLVVANNFFTLILGWELIGLTSFLLINFWKFKLTTLSCSFKAFIFNSSFLYFVKYL